MKALIILPLCLYSCILFAQQPYTIDGKIEKLKNGDQVFLVYPVNDKRITDSAIVNNGRFVFKGAIKEPTFASLFLNLNPYINRPGKGKILDSYVFLLEPAQIKLSATDSLKHLNISGSLTNTERATLKSMLKPNELSFSALNKEFEALPPAQQKDKTILAGMIEKERQLLKESYFIHLKFAEKHPNSYLSVISLAHIASHPELASAVEKAYQKLSPSLKKTDLGKGIPLLLASSQNTEIGKIAPNFTQLNPEGKAVQLTDFRGKYLLLDFWASWCGPCRKENPNVVAAYNKYKDKGFNVLGVSLDSPGEKSKWLKAIENDQLTWPQVSDLKGWENIVAKQYGIRSIPANFLIDPTGKIIARDLREANLHEELAKIFKGK